MHPDSRLEDDGRRKGCLRSPHATLDVSSERERSSSVAFDPSGNLWVAESDNNRVTEFIKGAGFSTGEAASLVLGQSGFNTAVAATTATGMDFPSGLAFDASGNLWVADLYNDRVTEFTTPFSTDQAASLVLGQSSFNTAVAATTATGFSQPSGVAFDSSGNLWVAEENNNRVMGFFSSAGFSTGEAASIVLGQSSFTTSTAATTATGMSYPWAVTADKSGNLWVADYTNNRVLGFGVAAPAPAPNPAPLPAVIPKQLTFHFNFPNAPTLVGKLVSAWGIGVMYNVPGLNAAVDINPYAISICYIPSQNGMQLSGFYSATPGNNSTEIFVSYYYSTVSSAQGWPTEPTCTS